MDTSKQYSDKYYVIPNNWTTGNYSTILRKWIDTQLRQLDITPTYDLMYDLATIQYLTNTKMCDAIEFFAGYMYGSSVNICDVEPFVLPNVRNVLNERDVKLSIIPGFSGKLYMPQATLLQRMLELEEYANTFPTQKNDSMMDYLIRGLSMLGINKSSTYLVQSNIGIIKERISFGKTYMMPALFCASLIPKFKKLDAPFIGMHHDDEGVPLNIVLCSTKVLNEWVNNIKTTTTLTHAKVSTAKDLEKLNMEKLPQVILIKDGNVNWNGKKQSALSHFLELFEDRVAARLIVDDYDMLKFKPEQKVPYTVFTWLVSSTENKSCQSKCSTSTYGYYFSKDVDIIGGVLYSLKCNADYSAVEFNIPKVEYFNTDDLDTLIPTLVKGEIPTRTTANINSDALLTARGDIPYVYGVHPLKIMLVCNSSSVMKAKYVEQFNMLGIKTAKLDQRNIHMFESNDLEVAVCGVMCGVNLGCVSHVVIPDYEYYTDAQLNQIVGRAQRISRKHNLQVYLISEKDEEVDYSAYGVCACDIKYKVHSDKKYDLSNTIIKPDLNNLEDVSVWIQSMYDTNEGHYSEIYQNMISEAIINNNLEALEYLWQGIYYNDRDCPDFTTDLYTAAQYGTLKTWLHVVHAHANYTTHNGNAAVDFNKLQEHARENADVYGWLDQNKTIMLKHIRDTYSGF